MRVLQEVELDYPSDDEEILVLHRQVIVVDPLGSDDEPVIHVGPGHLSFHPKSFEVYRTHPETSRLQERVDPVAELQALQVFVDLENFELCPLIVGGRLQKQIDVQVLRYCRYERLWIIYRL